MQFHAEVISLIDSNMRKKGITSQREDSVVLRRTVGNQKMKINCFCLDMILCSCSMYFRENIDTMRTI